MDDHPFTYRMLKAALETLTEAQLDQEVQTLPHNPTPEPTRLHPVIGINTVEYFCHSEGEISQETRSAVDFQHHPEQVVMLSDGSPFDKEGNMFFEMVEGGYIGNKTGKLYPGPFGSRDNGSQDGTDDSLRGMQKGPNNQGQAGRP